MNPSARSLQHLRKLGYYAQVVEKFNQYARVRQDLFGFIDIVAIKDGERGVLGVQSTSGSHSSEREKKALGFKELKVWLDAGNKFEIHGWAKKGPRGKRKLWTLKTVSITPDSLTNMG